MRDEADALGPNGRDEIWPAAHHIRRRLREQAAARDDAAAASAREEEPNEERARDARGLSGGFPKKAKDG